MPSDNFLRLPTVLKHLGVSRSSLYKYIADGLFTKQIKIGGCAVWPEHEVKKLFRYYQQGESKEQIRKQVSLLMSSRKPKASVKKENAS